MKRSCKSWSKPNKGLNRDKAEIIMYRIYHQVEIQSFERNEFLLEVRPCIPFPGGPYPTWKIWVDIQIQAINKSIQNRRKRKKYRGALDKLDRISGRQSHLWNQLQLGFRGERNMALSAVKSNPEGCVKVSRILHSTAEKLTAQVIW